MTDDNYDELHGQATDIHQHKWTPILAAHRIAANLDRIATLLPSLTAETRQAYLSGWNVALLSVDDMQQLLRDKALAMRIAAAVAEPTEEQQEAVWSNVVDQAGDMSRREVAEELVAHFTDADWLAEADQLAIDDDPEAWLKNQEN